MTVTDEPTTETVCCPLCGNESRAPWVTVRCPESPDEEHNIVRCGACGMLYLCPRPVPRQLARYYPEDYYAYVAPEVRPRSHGLKVAFWRRLGLLRENRPVGPLWLHRSLKWLVRALLAMRAMWLLPASPDARCFLEIGCGTGLRLGIAGDLGWEAIGLDISLTPLKVARERGYRGVVGHGERLPFVADRFDFISLHHVLEHVWEPREVLAEIKRILRPGGIAQIVVPNVESWSAQQYGACWRAYDAPRHLHHFTAETLRQAVSQAGLQVTYLRTLPDEWGIGESRQAAGDHRSITRLDRWRWKWRARRGQGEMLDLWCRHEP